jgi:ribosome-binding protein aMBF1 (putative translation factor)
MKDWQVLKKQLLQNSAFQQEYEQSELEYQISRSIIRARIEQGYTQKTLAQKLQTRQSVISRLESAKVLPSLSFLKRVADILHLSLSVQLK